MTAREFTEVCLIAAAAWALILWGICAAIRDTSDPPQRKVSKDEVIELLKRKPPRRQP